MASLRFRRLPYLAIAVFATLLILPAALTPVRTYDSFWIDWVWVDQFTQQLRRGVIYPRWLPLSHGGLGSPVFYYYPPFSFYLTGLLGLAGLTTYTSIIAAFGFGFALSGIAMYEWLVGWTRRPLVGAILYMAAPYHLLDFYTRGALAEFIAVSLIPFIALGVRKVATDGRPTLLALAYGTMILTHLPLALLTSFFLVAPLSLFHAQKSPRSLIGLGLALGLGIMLSGIYLIPALALEQYRDVDRLWEFTSLRASNWSVLRWNVAGPAEGMRVLIAGIALVIALPSAFLAITRRSGWAAYACFCSIMAVGLVPAFWDLPLIRAVQFPFRILPLAEFGFVTALALQFRLSPLLLVLPLSASSLLMVVSPPNAGSPSLREVAASYPDVPENLPPGRREYSWPSQWALALASSHPKPVKRGNETVEPVFYFPSWEVMCAGRQVQSYPDPENQLLTYRGANCVRRLVSTSAEKAGASASAIASLILLMLAAVRTTAGRARTQERKRWDLLSDPM